jgi:predicted transcriptional regulator of viral defense system
MTVTGIKMSSLKDFDAPVFTVNDVAHRLRKSADSVSGLLKRETAAGRVLRVRKGLYAFPENAGALIDGRTLSQNIYGPSYISMEYALSYRGLIPESVYTISNVSLNKSKHFSTPLGEFSYQRVPQKFFFSQVERIQGQGVGCFFVAQPLKALCDTLYCAKKNWTGLVDACTDLRIDQEDFPVLTGADIDELMENYRNTRVQRFLVSIKKDVS